MIDFIVQFRTEILIVIEIILIVLFWFLKKRPSLNEGDRIQVIIDECLDYYIKLAESSVVGAREKLLFVTSQIMARIHKSFPVCDDEYWRSVVVERIESTLSTPQKKG